MKSYYVYILASKRNGTSYVGVTSNLVKRINEHKEGAVLGFSKRYNVKKLVYYEETNDVQIALQREKRLKKWKRQWKLDLIEKENPTWRDLSNNFSWLSYPDLIGVSRVLYYDSWIPAFAGMTNKNPSFSWDFLIFG